MTLKRVPIYSPCYSSRGGQAVRLIVLHASEGAQTIESLGNWFAAPANEVSSHVGIDSKVNTVGEYVLREWKSWTASGANPVAVQAELCTPSGASDTWTAADWNAHPNMLANTAAWIAEEAAHFKIPIVRLTASQAQTGSAGVCQHSDLGSWGGGHHDLGAGFPVDAVLALAGGVTPPAPTPPAPKPPSSTVPPLHVDYFGQTHNPTVPDVRVWQTQMLNRGWHIGVDGIYGPQSAQVCRTFQQEKGLTADSLVGPQTWSMSWTAPIT